MKTTISNTLLIILSCLSFWGCNQESGSYDSNSAPIKSIILSDVKKYSGVPEVNYSETYLYDNSERLISQKYEQHVGNEIISSHYNVTYEQGKVEVSGDNLLLTYHIGDDNLAKSCSFISGLDVREYLFSYTKGDHSKWLSKIVETINGEVFSVITLTAIDKTKIMLRTQMRNEDVGEQILTFETHNNISIPNPYLLEIHPLAIHRAAFYARLFGETTHLITHIEVEALNEQTEYIYQWNKNDLLKHCRQIITSQKKKFYRDMKYSIERYD